MGLFCRLLCLCVWFLASTQTWAQEATQSSQEATQTIYQQQFTEEELEPTTIVFDFFMGERLTDSVLVTYTPSWAEFSDPTGLLESLENLQNPQALLPLFEGRIEGLERSIEGLGHIAVNPFYFQVTFRPDPNQLKLRTVDKDISEFNPPKGFTLKNEARYNFVTTFGDSRDRQSFFHDTTPTLGRFRIDWRGGINTDDDYQFDELAATYENLDVTASVGLLRSRGQNFALSRDYTGLRFERNQSTLFDNDLETATPLEVFVPSPSRVLVYQDGRLLYNEFHEFGLQQIDTSRFPSGSYIVDIEIQEENGRITQSTQLFTKTNRLVPEGRDDWSLEIGQLRDDINTTGAFIGQAGYRTRLNTNNELGFNIYAGEQVQIGELTHGLYWNDLELRSSVSASTDNDLAYSAEAIWLTDYGNWVGRISETIKGHNTRPDRSDLENFDPLVAEQSRKSVSYNKSLGPVSLRLNYTDIETLDTSETRYSADILWRMWINGPHQLDLNANYSAIAGEEDTYAALLAYRYRPRGSWSYQAQAGRLHDGEEGITTLRQSAQYDNQPTSTSPGTRLSIANQFDKADTNNNRTTLDVEHNTNLLRTRFTGLHNRDGNNQNSSASLDLATAFVYTPGKAELTAPPKGEASYLIELTGDADGTSMVIRNNGQTLTTAEVGQIVSIPITPFRKYSITVSPEDSNSLLDYRQTADTFVLNPGNIKRTTIDVNRVRLVFGRLVDTSGDAIGWSRLKGPRSAGLSDQFGNFQIELTNKGALFVQNDEANCTAALPHMDGELPYAYLGDILCL